MLTIICGEDTIASRNYFVSLKHNFSSQGIEVRNLKFEEITDLLNWSADSPSLFFEKRVFFSEHIIGKIKKDNKIIVSLLQKINSKREVHLFNWESISSWELKFKKIGQIKEFKPNQTIFKLLDSLYPGKRADFISILDVLASDLDENFIFQMLVRYTRNLILTKEGVNLSSLQTWQMRKYQSQANRWKTENLINFYEALFKIEVGIKTSNNPFPSIKSLEILACHFL